MEEGLRALLFNPGVAGWNKPYLDNMREIKKDAWGHEYIYTVPGEHGWDFDIISAGPDGQIGTDDDIVSWKRN